MVWSFHLNDLDSSDVRALLALHFASLQSMSPAEACHVLPAEGLSSSSISFWSVREDRTLLGFGALKELTPEHGEIKSMRTAPHMLGRGVGTSMLIHLVAQARSRGYNRLSLETGSTERFSAALRLYQREGFVTCGPFGGYKDTPFTAFLTREL